jgi:hypothetical protein
MPQQGQHQYQRFEYAEAGLHDGDELQGHGRTNGRSVLEMNDSFTVPMVPRPVVCLEAGQGLLFDLPEGKDTYPVYIKDSFLNTNPAFDYGEFRNLATMANSASAQVRLQPHICCCWLHLAACLRAVSLSS